MSEDQLSSLPHIDGAVPGATLLSLIATQVIRTPDAVAIMGLDRQPLTYTGLESCLEQTSTRLAELGVGRTDRVAVALPAGPELAVCLLAVTKVAACAPLNPDYTENEFARYLDRLRPSTLIVQPGTAGAALAPARERGLRILELTPTLADGAGCFGLSHLSGELAVSAPFISAHADDVALLLQTSGTTA